MKKLRDLIYVDEGRLDTYVEQIGSPTGSHTALLWKFGVKPSGLSAEVTGQRAERERNRSDKIEIFLSHLKKTKMLDTGRVVDTRRYYNTNDRVFRLEEECNAIPVEIPTENGSFALKIWISDRDQFGEPNRLILIQNPPRDDAETYNPGSGYSVLLALQESGCNLEELFSSAKVGPLGRVKILQQQVDADGYESEIQSTAPRRKDHFESMAELSRTSMLMKRNRDAYHEALTHVREDKLQERFSSDPGGFLSWLGAKIGSQRQIETLYRIRDIFMDPILPSSVVTIGYPIFIS